MRPVAAIAALAGALTAALGCGPVRAANGDAIASASPSALVDAGRSIYNSKCLHCHGPNMVNPGTTAYDLRKFPLDGHDRFVDSVTNGKNAMPSWKADLSSSDIEALWAFVQARGRS